MIVAHSLFLKILFLFTRSNFPAIFISFFTLLSFSNHLLHFLLSNPFICIFLCDLMHNMIYIPYRHWWTSEQDLQLNHFCWVSSLNFNSHIKHFCIDISKQDIDDMILSSCFPCLSEWTHSASITQGNSFWSHSFCSLNQPQGVIEFTLLTSLISIPFSHVLWSLP